MAKGWLDNYGKEANYNDSHTSAPEGFEGDGYSNVGRNYSPAWGGQFQGGGSISGSVGFTYARIGGAPSNGPYAKKTMPSAQTGVKLDMYGTPITAIEVNDPSSNRTSYDARTNRMILGSDTNAENRDKAIAHENYHASQYADNRMNYDIAHHTDNEQWARMQKQPAMTSNNEVWSNYYDRKPREIDDFVNNFINNSDFLKNYTNTIKQGSPSIANDIIFNTVYNKTNTDKALYLNPGTSEGEAQRYEDTGIKSFQNGGEMCYYQNGLDWKPKGMRDGGWLGGYEKAQDGTQVLNSRQKRGVELLLKEPVLAKQDAHELHTTGQIKNPRSVHFKQAVPKREEVQTHTPQTTTNKTWEVLTHPMTAAGYVARHENLPDNFSRGEINAHEQAVNLLNPFFYADESKNFIKNVATGHPLDATMNALNIAPVVSEFAPEIRSIKTSIAPELRQELRTNGLSFEPKFNSEIDWSKWNKEMPNNTQLMKEYNTIEQTSKANGNWMKNPDGSVFKGTPEQFVQQNSSNFKKAFGNSKLVNVDGSPKIIQHGSEKNNIKIFKSPSQIKNFQKRTATTKNTEHTFFTQDENWANNFARKDGKVYNVYANVENPYIVNNPEEMYNPEIISNYRDYDAVTNLKLGEKDIRPFREIAIPNWNITKSSVGNNGMFDMTNPNIYKAIVPGAIGLGATSQIQDEEPIPGMKQGGIIKDNRGQWAQNQKNYLPLQPNWLSKFE